MSESLTFRPRRSSADTFAAEDRRAVRLMWWLAAGGAAASIVLGVMILAWPRATLVVGAVLFGLWLLTHGVIRIVNAVTASAEEPFLRALGGVIGLLFIIAGVICLRNVLVSLATVATVIGLSWLLTGIVELVSAFTRGDGSSPLLLGVLGALSALGGLIVLIWPGPTLATLVYVTGVWLLVIGAVQLVLVINNRPGRVA